MQLDSGHDYTLPNAFEEIILLCVRQQQVWIIVRLLKDTLVYICGSLAEGFGNETSDIDVYVICESLPDADSYVNDDESALKRKNALVRNIIHDGVRYDLEYVEMSEFENSIKILERLDFSTIPNKLRYQLTDQRIDMLHRLKFGQPLINTDKFFEVRNTVRFDKLGLLIALKLSWKYESLLEDLEGACGSKDYGTAFFLSRKLIDIACAMYLAIHGETNPSDKWTYRKLLSYQQATGNSTLLEMYLELHSVPFDMNTVLEHVQKVLNHVQNLNLAVEERLLEETVAR